MQRIRYLIWKELLELKDDPRVFVIVVLAPILQLLMLGYAATTDVREVPVLVVDADRSAASRDLIVRFTASPQGQRARRPRRGNRPGGAGDCKPIAGHHQQLPGG